MKYQQSLLDVNTLAQSYNPVTLSDINNFNNSNNIVTTESRRTTRSMQRVNNNDIVNSPHQLQQRQVQMKKSGTKRRGKQVIPIKFIDNLAKRINTFNKRDKGLVKKGIELSVLTGAEVDLTVRLPDTGEIFRFCNLADCSTFRSHVIIQEACDAPHFTRITEDSYANGLSNLHNVHAGLREKKRAGRRRKVSAEDEELEKQKQLSSLTESERNTRILLDDLKNRKYQTTTLENRGRRYDDATLTQRARPTLIPSTMWNNVIPLASTINQRKKASPNNNNDKEDTREDVAVEEEEEEEEMSGNVNFINVNERMSNQNHVQETRQQIGIPNDFVTTYVGVTDTVTNEGGNIYVTRDIQTSLQIKIQEVSEALKSRDPTKISNALQRHSQPQPPQQQQDQFTFHSQLPHPPSPLFNEGSLGIPLMPFSPFISSPSHYMSQNDNAFFPSHQMTPKPAPDFMQSPYSRRSSIDGQFNLQGMEDWNGILNPPCGVTTFNNLFG